MSVDALKRRGLQIAEVEPDIRGEIDDQLALAAGIGSDRNPLDLWLTRARKEFDGVQEFIESTHRDDAVSLEDRAVCAVGSRDRAAMGNRELPACFATA